MSLAIAAAVTLPLFSISANDPILEKRNTFVSPAAQQALQSSQGEEVLCLKRERNPKHKRICLVSSEWAKAVEIHNADPKKYRTNYRIRPWGGGFGELSTSQFPTLGIGEASFARNGRR